MRKLRVLILFAFILGGYLQVLRAQETVETGMRQSRWYMGGDVGVSFGSSTFKSFGANKSRVGYGLGLLGGYHINYFLSAESELRYTHLGMETYDCCQNLWLGADGNRYLAPLAGQENWQFKGLLSAVNVYSLGIHLNVDFLQMFRPESRWSLMLSPAVYGAGTTAKIKTQADKKTVRKGDSNFHFGVGGDIGIGYQLCEKMNIRLYSGVTYLTGKGMDGLPQMEHKSNYLWNTGVKVTFALGKRTTRTSSPIVEVAPIAPEVTPPSGEEVKPETVVPSAEVQPAKEEASKETTPAHVEKTIYETSVYFSLNQCQYIEPSQYKTVAELLKKIKENEGATITIVGKADRTGTLEMNERISARRAETIKRYLIRKGIPVDCIMASGDGVDTTTADNDLARRAEIKLMITEK